MICEFCTGNTIDKKVRRQHWLHGKLYIVENVDAEVCTECGERYFHVKTLETIDRMLGSEHEVKERIGVEIITM
ncbi:MAG: YgiT-type zinc finger protein [Nitrospirota bacterium]